VLVFEKMGVVFSSVVVYEHNDKRQKMKVQVQRGGGAEGAAR
jgi:hypothetical protein